MAPLGAKGVVLKKQVIFTLMPHQAVGVIHPVFSWSEVKLWAVLVIDFRGHISL